MNQKLITLNGEDEGRAMRDITKLGDIEAGLLFWKDIADKNPGITWGEALFGEHQGLGFSLSKTFSKIGKGLKNTVKVTGNVIKDAGNTIGNWSGSAIRLATDEQVVDTISRAGTAYATGGQSEALRSLTNSFGTSKNPVSAGGASLKTELASMPTIGGVDAKWIMAGAAALIGVVLLTQRK